MFGWKLAGDSDNGFGVGCLVNVDSTAIFKFSVPFTDSSTAPAARQRHILVANNSYGHEKWYIDYLVNNPYMPDSAINKVHRMPAMSGKTYKFFSGTTNGHKNFPYMNLANNYPAVDTTLEWPPAYNAAVDPGFFLNPENIDSIKAFLLGRWMTGKDVNWSFDILSDIQQSWPLSEDMSYTNTTLKTAAMGGFPLGDLFHWWPSQYTSWKAQKAAEEASITNMLTNGISTGVEQTQSIIPLKYELGQNFPNPFNPTTKINYSIQEKGYVTLKIFNLLGQEVATVFEGERSAGNYTATFSGKEFSSGVYFYRLQAGNFSSTKKLVLMK
jgi:hypothetical protein